MRFGELFELVITLLIFLVIWILPRIVAARAADKKRRKQSSAKSASPPAPKTAAEPKRSWSKEIFSKLIDDTFLDTDKKKPPVQAEESTPEEPVKPVSVFDGEERETGGAESDESAPPEQDYQWDRQKRPSAGQHTELPKGVSSRSGRSPLQKAVIWKELLDPPKALRREPFP